jgi:hypothetical protein
MNSIIEELMLNEASQGALNVSPKKLKELAQREIEFEKMLNENERELFRDLSEEKFKLFAKHEKEYFKCGFKLGFNLVIEVFN